eukprot:GEMP01063467.1.p1 GENE.GEMP01063467.1~~GEMP01063467.1.p1  ORF type:complete len:277 (+),score=64.41 GEMP01063467.1:29-859(+)
MADRLGRSGQRLVGGVQKTQPMQVPPPMDNVFQTPQLEKEHVHAVYDTIASHWSHTRYAAWPKVNKFICDIPPRSLICDLGCGNAKNAIVARALGHMVIASDISKPLVEVCKDREPGLNLMVSDCLRTPFRTGTFDAGLLIAVLHHLSSEPRRVQAIREAMRVLKIGGKLLLYAWAQEQEGGVSRHQFDSPDVFVAWHHKLPKVKAAEWSEDAARALESKNACGVADPEKNAIVYQRYCHVYAEGELESLFAQVETARVEAVYLDTGNWCVIAERI